MKKIQTSVKTSLSLYAKRALIFAIAVAFATGSMAFKGDDNASADQYDDKIAALQQEMNEYQAKANELNQQASTLQNAIAILNNEIAALQAQINESQAKYDQLVIKIADTEKKIAENKDALGLTLADLYVDDGISPIEMIASSKNIGDFLDKQEYRNSVKEELSSTIQNIKDLKQQLSSQKEEVSNVLASQKAAQEDSQAKRTEQSSLLASTQNDEANYQKLIKDNASEIAAAKAAQAALVARASASGGYSIVASGSLGAYTSLWAPNSCTMGGPGGWYSYGGADGNGGDGRGYGCRQCASYVAWKIASLTGKYYKWGNGGQFAGRAIAAGYTNLASSPQPGSIAVMWGNPGHVAWVEAVSGNQVLVSQYNWMINGQYGMYSEMWLNKSVFDQYVKII